jgi:hypothetical protein
MHAVQMLCKCNAKRKKILRGEFLRTRAKKTSRYFFFRTIKPRADRFFYTQQQTKKSLL